MTFSDQKPPQFLLQNQDSGSSENTPPEGRGFLLSTYLRVMIGLVGLSILSNGYVFFALENSHAMFNRYEVKMTSTIQFYLLVGIFGSIVYICLFMGVWNYQRWAHRGLIYMHIVGIVAGIMGILLTSARTRTMSNVLANTSGVPFSDPAFYMIIIVVGNVISLLIYVFLVEGIEPHLISLAQIKQEQDVEMSHSA